MAMTQAKTNFLNRLIQQMKLMEAEYGEWESLNALANGQTTNYTTALTNADLASVTAYEGVTEATIDECMYIILGALERYRERIEHVSNLTQRG